MLSKDELDALQAEFRGKWLREGQDDLSDVFAQAAQAAELARTLAIAREKMREADAFDEWAQSYLDSGKWAGHRYDDAVKQELLARDAERDALAAECARLSEAGDHLCARVDALTPEDDDDEASLCLAAIDGWRGAPSCPSPLVAAHAAAWELANADVRLRRAFDVLLNEERTEEREQEGEEADADREHLLRAFIAALAACGKEAARAAERSEG